MTAAFKEFSAKKLTQDKKPSIRKALAAFREKAKELNASRQQTKHKDWSPPHKKTALYKGGVPTLRNFCGAAVFSCKGLGGTLPGRGAYQIARVYVLDFRSAP